MRRPIEGKKDEGDGPLRIRPKTALPCLVLLWGLALPLPSGCKIKYGGESQGEQPFPCQGSEDCPLPHEACMGAQCSDGKCVRVPAPAGAALPPDSQVNGDCKRLVCDGDGHPVVLAAPMDLPLDDQNDCTEEVCENDQPEHLFQPAGFLCKADGVCNGKGGCGVCVPGTQRCKDDRSTSLCSEEGQWSKPTLCTVQTPACKASKCRQIRQLAVGAAHACVQLESGHVECWGSNEQQQLGTASGMQAHSAPRFDQVDYGPWHACAVRNGRVSCWGANEVGQLGSDNGISTNTPQVVPATGFVTQVAVGDRHSCALSGGQVRCWGGGLVVPASKAPAAARPAPKPKSYTHGASKNKPHNNAVLHASTRLQLGTGLSCALLSDGDYRCIGRTTYPLPPPQPVPRLGSGVASARAAEGSAEKAAGHPIANLQDAVELGCGADFCCVRTQKKAVYCWGGNSQGQLGTGDTKPRKEPYPVAKLDRADQLAVGRDFACVRQDNGAVQCWGSNAHGQISNKQPAHHSTPTVRIPASAKAKHIALGDAFGCAQLADASVHCWGDNRFGQLGRSSNRTMDASGSIRW